MKFDAVFAYSIPIRLFYKYRLYVLLCLGHDLLDNVCKGAGTNTRICLLTSYGGKEAPKTLIFPYEDTRLSTRQKKNHLAV